MGTTKRHFYTENQLEMANLCKALGHPARITIVEKLLEYENLNCKDLQFFIPLAQSTISQHLEVLYNAGILGYEANGNGSNYKVNKIAMKKVTEYLQKVNNSSQLQKYSLLFTNCKPQYEVLTKT